jgi:hypothetical protein
MVFEFLEIRLLESPVRLEKRVEEQLVEAMAVAIMAVAARFDASVKALLKLSSQVAGFGTAYEALERIEQGAEFRKPDAAA